MGKPEGMHPNAVSYIDDENNDMVFEVDLEVKGYMIIGGKTTTERDALTPVNGMMIYNSTVHKFQGYANGVWVDLG